MCTARIVIALTFALTWLATTALAAAQAEATIENPQFKSVITTIQTWIDKGDYPSAAIIIARDNQIVCRKFFGPANGQSQFHLASMTKWLEAATMMTLVDDGKISLDDPIAKYLPQFTGEKGQATIRQCLSHTGGINRIKVKSDYESKALDDRVQQLADGAMVEVPGKIFNYGDKDLSLCAKIAETVLGQKWEDIFQARIARPCHMQHTHLDSSCPDDYMNFLQMLANHGRFDGQRILSAKAIDEMQADQVHNAAVNHSEWIQLIRGAKHNGVYGLGEWREAVDAQGRSLRVSSPSYQGGYPWIDKPHNVYGVFMGINSSQRVDGYHKSPSLSKMVTEAIDAETPAH